MKIDTENLYFVIKPYPEMEDYEEMFVDATRNLADLKDLFGVFKPEDFYGIYTKRASAKKDADKLWKELQRNSTTVDPSTKERFGKFIQKMEQLSSEYGIAIQSVGGVLIFDTPTLIQYDQDHTSGDLIPFWDKE